MKFELRKISFVLIFLIFSIFLTQLLRNNQLLYAMFSIYLLLSEAIIEICFEMGQSNSKKMRVICWIILNALVGLALGIYSFVNNDKVLSSIFIIWMIFSTVTNIISVKNKHEIHK